MGSDLELVKWRHAYCYLLVIPCAPSPTLSETQLLFTIAFSCRILVRREPISREVTLDSCGKAYNVFCANQRTHDYLPGMTIVPKVDRLSGRAASQLRRRTMCI